MGKCAYLVSAKKKANVVVVYKPLSSRSANDLMLKPKRVVWLKNGSFKKYEKRNGEVFRQTTRSGFSCRSKPKNSTKKFWTPFLSQRTAFLSGTELNTTRHKTPSLFVNIIREKRGYYKFILEPIFDFSEPYKMGIITSIFTEKLEKLVMSNPENYLWSHKRWKHMYKNEYQKRWINKSIEV